MTMYEWLTFLQFDVLLAISSFGDSESCQMLFVQQGIDVKSMGRIFIGLIKCGAWGCFDEFNRLEEAVLSAVSMQIQVIQDAIKQRSPSVELLGRKVSSFLMIGGQISKHRCLRLRYAKSSIPRAASLPLNWLIDWFIPSLFVMHFTAIYAAMDILNDSLSLIVYFNVLCFFKNFIAG